MKIRYNREMDIATIEICSKKIDYAKEAQNIIIHFSKDNEPVLLEILDASKFLTNVTRATIRSIKETPISLEL
jgi:uncharacterized protein YuzE